MSNYLEICEQAARAGGAELLKSLGHVEVREKGPADPVTEADFASQEAVRNLVRRHFPDHDFLSEEEPHSRMADGQMRWILDPLDGTQNYVHGLPLFAVSLALEENGQILVGCVYNPISDECYTAAQGQGARCNGEVIRVSRARALSEALVAISLPPRVHREGPELKSLVHVSVEAQGIRRIGSSALNLCWVAAGKLDAFFATDTKIWDVAAGVLLVQEAGGTVTALTGGSFNVRMPRLVAAASESLAAQIRSKLAIY